MAGDQMLTGNSTETPTLPGTQEEVKDEAANPTRL